MCPVSDEEHAVDKCAANERALAVGAQDLDFETLDRADSILDGPDSEQGPESSDGRCESRDRHPVSYTHLTLPTIYSV